MKKLVILALALILCLGLVGCNKGGGGGISLGGTKTMTCTMSESDDEGYKTESKVVIKYSGDEIKTVAMDITSEMDPEYIEMSYAFASIIVAMFEGVKGFEFKMSKTDKAIVMSYTVDYSKFTEEEAKKLVEKLGGDYDDAQWKGGKQSLEEFKKENLEGYTCK